MLNYIEHCEGTERRLRQLLAAEREVFSQEDIAEVEEFIDAREYGLALEAFAAILLDVALALDGRIVEEVQQIANEMGLFEEEAINNVVARYERQNYRITL